MYFFVALFPGKGDAPSGWSCFWSLVLESPDSGGWPPGHGPLMAAQVLLLSSAPILVQRKHLALLSHKLLDVQAAPTIALPSPWPKKAAVPASFIYTWTLYKLESATRLCVLQTLRVACQALWETFLKLPSFDLMVMVGNTLMHWDFTISFMMSLLIKSC